MGSVRKVGISSEGYGDECCGNVCGTFVGVVFRGVRGEARVMRLFSRLSFVSI